MPESTSDLDPSLYESDGDVVGVASDIKTPQAKVAGQTGPSPDRSREDVGPLITDVLEEEEATIGFQEVSQLFKSTYLCTRAQMLEHRHADDEIEGGVAQSCCDDVSDVEGPAPNAVASRSNCLLGDVYPDNVSTQIRKHAGPTAFATAQIEGPRPCYRPAVWEGAAKGSALNPVDVAVEPKGSIMHTNRLEGVKGIASVHSLPVLPGRPSIRGSMAPPWPTVTERHVNVR